jgi:hypothetical protein
LVRGLVVGAFAGSGGGAMGAWPHVDGRHHPRAGGNHTEILRLAAAGGLLGRGTNPLPTAAPPPIHIVLGCVSPPHGSNGPS